MDDIAGGDNGADQPQPEPVTAALPEAPRRWIDTGRSRLRAQLSARTKHPGKWLRSTLTRGRGVTSPLPEPTSNNEVLERLVELPVSVWTYGFEHHSVRHMGPMAQDFANAFGLGSTDKAINMVDANGVCMASIQALYRRVVALETEMAKLRVAQPNSGDDED